MTFYFGPVLWADDIFGRQFPDTGTELVEKIRRKFGCGPTDKIVLTRDLKGRLYATNPKVIGPPVEGSNNGGNGRPAHLYLGAHYINDPTHGLQPGSAEWDKAAKQANVRLMEDGAVVAKREIKEGQEILMVYSEGPDLVYGGKYYQEKNSENDVGNTGSAEDEPDAVYESDNASETVKRPKKRRRGM